MALSDLYEGYKDGRYSKNEYIGLMHKEHQLLFEYSEFLADSEIASLEILPDNIVAVTRQNGIRLYLDRFDSRFIPIEIMNFKHFDPAERPLLEEMAKRSKTILDIGGNIGWYSLNFSRWSPDAKVYAFEPIPRTYDYFVRHMSLNSIENVIPNNCAVSDAEGEKEFYWTELETGSASMKNIQDRKNINKVKCKVVTVDDYCARNNIEDIDFIKCDIEGSELFAFRGARSMLEKSRPMVFTEMLRKWSAKFGYHPNDIMDIFDNLGYQCLAYEEGRLVSVPHVDETTQPTNFFFLCPDKHKTLIEGYLSR